MKVQGVSMKQWGHSCIFYWSVRSIDRKSEWRDGNLFFTCHICVRRFSTPFRGKRRQQIAAVDGETKRPHRIPTKANNRSINHRVFLLFFYFEKLLLKKKYGGIERRCRRHGRERWVKWRSSSTWSSFDFVCFLFTFSFISALISSRLWSLFPRSTGFLVFFTLHLIFTDLKTTKSPGLVFVSITNLQLCFSFFFSSIKHEIISLIVD